MEPSVTASCRAGFPKPAETGIGMSALQNDGIGTSLGLLNDSATIMDMYHPLTWLRVGADAWGHQYRLHGQNGHRLGPRGTGGATRQGRGPTMPESAGAMGYLLTAQSARISERAVGTRPVRAEGSGAGPPAVWRKGGVNWYGYAEDNPAAQVDPAGLRSGPCSGKPEPNREREAEGR